MKATSISLKNMYQQNFDFPYEMIKLILASYNIVKKLYFTCKYFPEKYRSYLIDNLNHEYKLVFKDSVKEYAANLNAVNSINDKIWIGSKIITTQKCIYPLISNIKRCTINTIYVASSQDLNLSWNDFKILAEAGTIKDLTIGKLLDADNKMVSVEDICAYAPKLTELR
uniref:Uncharacterized protein n=1 Tax=Panagrolaimus sp. ES5 TaxID=591445 RepID=A0AC34FH94_9BILA